IAPSQLHGADDRLRVVIERNHARPQSPGRQAEQPAARPDVQKTQSRERIDLQHSFERRFGCDDLLIPNAFQKAAPVLAELETFAASDLFGVPVGRFFVDSLVHFSPSKIPGYAPPGSAPVFDHSNSDRRLARSQAARTRGRFSLFQGVARDMNDSSENQP